MHERACHVAIGEFAGKKRKKECHVWSEEDAETIRHLRLTNLALIGLLNKLLAYGRYNCGTTRNKSRGLTPSKSCGHRQRGGGEDEGIRVVSFQTDPPASSRASECTTLGCSSSDLSAPGSSCRQWRIQEIKKGGAQSPLLLPLFLLSLLLPPLFSFLLFI